MPSFTTRFADGWEASLEHLSLALVPLVTALLNTDKIESILAYDGFHVGLKFGIPLSVLDLWTFVDPPSSGANINIGVPVVGFPFVLIAIPVAVIVQSALSAGYFGSIGEALTTGGYDFEENVRAFFKPFLWLTLIPLVAFLPLAVLGFGGGPDVLVPLVILMIPVMFVLGYLFYATPYLIVLRRTDLVSAAKQSYELAIETGPYLSYFLGFMLFVVVVSPVASLIVVNLPIVGLVIGLAGCSVLGLAGNMTTMRFIADIDPGSPSLGTWSDGADTPPGDGNGPTPPRE